MNQDLNEVITHLQNQINILNERSIQQQQAANPTVQQHQALTFNIQRPEDVSLNLYKTLPEFSGDRMNYATWRTVVKTAMNLLGNHQNSMQYCQALMITRNKITGAASIVLNNYNTPFNFDAIMDRLDFTYADKRPIYILEQELLVLQQNKLSVDEFYDKVNAKMNTIINKINMTHAEPATTRALMEGVNEKALRTFITGLSNRRGEILHASNPTSLPEAYAKLQTIINDQERIRFANRYNHTDTNKRNFEIYPAKNPQFRFKDPEKTRDQAEPTPMEVDRTSTRVHVERPSSQNIPNPMNSYFKRNLSQQNSTQQNSSQRLKQQRINNMDTLTPYAGSIVQDQPSTDEVDDTASVTSENTVSTKSNIFLGVWTACLASSVQICRQVKNIQYSSIRELPTIMSLMGKSGE